MIIFQIVFWVFISMTSRMKCWDKKKIFFFRIISLIIPLLNFFSSLLLNGVFSWVFTVSENLLNDSAKSRNHLFKNLINQILSQYTFGKNIFHIYYVHNQNNLKSILYHLLEIV